MGENNNGTWLLFKWKCPVRKFVLNVSPTNVNRKTGFWYFFSMPNSNWGIHLIHPTINVQIETPEMSNSRIFIQICCRHFHGTLSFPNNPKFFVFTFFDLCGTHWTCLEFNVLCEKNMIQPIAEVRMKSQVKFCYRIYHYISTR